MKRTPVILFLLLLLVFFAPLGCRELFSPDEARYAEVPREMLETGNFITPYLNGIPYFEKPAPGYWFFAASMKVFGQNAFALRFPCMIAALLTALCVYVLAGRLPRGEDVRVRLTAVGLYLSFPLIFVLAGYGILDVIFSFFLTLAMLLFYFAYTAKNKGWKWLGLYLFGSALGAAFLVKGFLGFALPGVAIFFFLMLPADFRELKTAAHWKTFGKNVLTLPWLPLLGAVIVVLPWALAVHFEQPEFWKYFFWEEHIQRFTSSAATQHKKPFWFFVPVLFGGIGLNLIWIRNVWTGLRRHYSCGFAEPMVRYACCWLVFEFLLLSASSGKLGTYIVPCYPAVALLMTAGLWNAMDERVRTADFAMKLLCLILIFAVPLFLAWETAFPQWAIYSRPGEGIKAYLLAAAGLSMAMLLFSARLQQERWKKIFLSMAVMLPGMAAWNFVIPDYALEVRAPGPVIRAAKARFEAEKTGKTPVIITFRDPVQQVCWDFRRSDVFLFRSRGELKRGLEFQGTMQEKFFPDTKSVSAFIKRVQAEGKPILFVIPNDVYEDRIAEYPEPVWRVNGNPANEDAFSVLRY